MGNKASGNTLNGIAVPAGELAGAVRWGLRGIPYIVESGALSVGVAPKVASVSPQTVEQGQSTTLTLHGVRLDGLASASFDQPGLAVTPFSGGSGSQAFVQVQVGAAAAVGPAGLRLQVDAGEVVVPNALTVTPPMPAISTLQPSTVLAGAGPTEITVSGRNFAASSEVLFNSASVPTTFASATQLRAMLPSQPVTRHAPGAGAHPESPRSPGSICCPNSASLVVQAPVPPTVAVEPTPIALPPDDKPREVTIRLSKADYRDNTLTFAISDPAKASVMPTSLVIPAGQTVAKLTIVPKLAGTATLIVDSATLQRVSVPLFITADFRGANTAYAAPVGVFVEASGPTSTQQHTVTNANVGVAVGGVLTRVTPAAWVVGAQPSVTIEGVGIPSDAQVSVVPSTGISASAATVNAEGTALTVTLGTAADAATGGRRLVVRDGAGKQLVFADPAQSVVQIMSGLPSIDSIEPIFAPRGTTIKLVVRGRHLHQGAVRVSPQTGIRVDSAPVVSADGTTLMAWIEIAADALLGARTVQVSTPSGSSEATPGPQNTFSVAESVRETVTPIASQLVGVMVGSAPVQTAERQPHSSLVGVLLGAGITEVTPNAGVIGTQVEVTVRGAGLDAVTSVGLHPSAGVSIGALSVNAQYTELRFTVAVDAGAALGARRLVLTAADRPVTFARPSDGSFLVSAPVPELASVEPQVLVAGQAAVNVTVRGRNFNNVSAVRIEPAEGITVAGPFVVNVEGTTLGFNASAAAGTSSGIRAVVVTTPAGESVATVLPGNMIRVANQLGATYANLLTSPVGVVVGSSHPAQEPVNSLLASSAVGVTVASVAVPENIDGTVASTAVGVVVGAAAQGVTPSGWLQGASGNIVISGRALDAVTSTTVQPSTGILLGAPVASDGGALLSIPISVAPDAPLVARRLRLTTAAGAGVSFADASGWCLRHRQLAEHEFGVAHRCRTGQGPDAHRARQQAQGRDPRAVLAGKRSASVG